MGLLIVAVDSAFPVFSERPEPDILLGFVVQLVAVVAPVPLGGFDVGPGLTVASLMIAYMEP